MKSNLRCVLWCTLLSCLFLPAVAQPAAETKLALAVLPFVAPKGAEITSAGNLNAVQEAVAKEFTTKSRFMVLDRSKFEDIVKGLKIETSEQFLNSELLERGKSQGAQYFVTGVLNELKVVKSEKNVPKNPLKPFGEKVKVIVYQSSIRLSFSVIDVQTQQTIHSEPINISSKDYVDGSEVSSINNVLEDVQKTVREKLRTIFPVEMKIVSVDKIGRNGLPETVLINGGGSMFTGKESRNLRLGVYVAEEVGGFKRLKQVGELKVMEVEGELVKCQVKDGEKAIQENMNTGLLVKVITK